MRVLKAISVALASAVLLAGCTHAALLRPDRSEKLTNEQVERMGDEEAIALLNCQMDKAVEDLGQGEFLERYADDWNREDEEEGDTLQVTWWNDGYRCEGLVR